MNQLLIRCLKGLTIYSLRVYIDVVFFCVRFSYWFQSQKELKTSPCERATGM